MQGESCKPQVQDVFKIVYIRSFVSLYTNKYRLLSVSNVPVEAQ